MNDSVAWGLLGTGKIARVLAHGLAESRSSRLVAVGSRTQAAAEAFGDACAVPRRHGSYEALLADPEVQVIYIATPHPQHAEWAIKAAEAGKHVLCEKPLALNYAEALAIVEAARRHDRFLMEAFMYRCHPQTTKIVQLVRDGVIGRVRLIQAAFSYDTPAASPSRALRHELGGGGILDVGCYATSMARLIAGAATGAAVAEPLDVKGCGHIDAASRVDVSAIAALLFPEGILATLTTGVQLSGENSVRIVGSAGTIDVPDPWVPGRAAGHSRLTVHRAGSPDPREITVETTQGLYALEVDTVARYLEQRQAPAMTWDDTLGNMRTLDRWRASIGLVYDMEKEAV